MMNNYFVWINGEFVHPDQVPSSLFEQEDDAAVSVVRDFRIYDTDSGPAIFRLTEHIRQFLEMIREKGFDIHLSEEQLCEMVIRTLMYNQMRQGFVRTRLLVRKSWDDEARYSARDEDAFILAILSRDHAEEFGPGTCGDGESSIALGNDVPELSTLFLVNNQTIYTPPSTLFGNTLVRNAVITLAQDLGYQVLEKKITRKQIINADEVFLSNSVGELLSVCEFNAFRIADGQVGPITSQLQAEFQNTMLGRGERSREWLEWVGATFLGL